MVALRVRVCVCVQSLYFDFHTKNIIFYFRQYVRSVRNVIERDCDRTIADVIEHSIDLIKFQFAYTFLRSKFSAQFMVMAATPCARWSCQTFPKQTKTVNYAANWSRTKSCNELVVVRPPVGVKLTNFQRFGYFMIFDLLIFFWFCYDVMLSLCGITYVLRINCVCENMMSSRWSNRKLKKKCMCLCVILWMATATKQHPNQTPRWSVVIVSQRHRLSHPNALLHTHTVR